MNLHEKFDRSYDLAREALVGMDVSIKHFRHLSSPAPTSLLGMIADSSPAYSVEAIALEDGVNVMRYGRFGFTESGPNVIPFPTPMDADDAAAELAKVLVPFVLEQIDAAAADRASYTGNGPIEARDAVRRIS